MIGVGGMCCMSEVDEDIFWEKEVKVAEVEKNVLCKYAG